MKKRFISCWLALLPGLAALSLMAGCHPAKVTLTPETVTVKAGESVTLTAVSTSKKDVSFAWTSNQAEVATVDATGKVTGMQPGIAAIHATGGYSKKQAKVVVKVLPSGAPMKPKPAKPAVQTGEETPPIKTDEGEKTAEGEAEGQAESMAEGSPEGGTEEASSEMPARHEAPAPPLPQEAKISHTPDTLVLTEGGTAYITPMSTVPADTAFTWATSNDAVATITPQGQVKAIGPGVTYITSTATRSGAQGSTKMIVTAAPHANEGQPEASGEGEYQFLTVYPGNVSLQVGQSVALSVLSPSPLDANFTWTTTNASVATVNATGQVAAVGEGSAFIIATSPYTLSQGLASIVVGAASGEPRTTQ